MALGLAAEIPDHRLPPGGEFFVGTQPGLLVQPHHDALVGHHGHAFGGLQFFRSAREELFPEIARGVRTGADSLEMFRVNRVQLLLAQQGNVDGVDVREAASSAPMVSIP